MQADQATLDHFRDCARALGMEDLVESIREDRQHWRRGHARELARIIHRMRTTPSRAGRIPSAPEVAAAVGFRSHSSVLAAQRRGARLEEERR